MIRSNLNIKLFFIIKVILIYLFFGLKSYSDNTSANINLVVLGQDKAPVKIKIFSSLTCPHCANFHINVVSEIKKEYIETGKVQLIFIDFPLDQVAFNASKLLHCIDKKKQSILNKSSKKFKKKINEVKNKNIRDSLSQLLDIINND